VLIDFRQNQPGDKDGIYVIRTGNGLQVKRVQVELGKGLVTVRSDNPAYEAQPHKPRGQDAADLTEVRR